MDEDICKANKQLAMDFEALSKLENSSLLQLAQITVEFLLGGNAGQFQQSLSEIARNNSIDTNMLKLSSKTLLIVLNKAMKEGYSKHLLERQCFEFGLNETATNLITSVWQSNSNTIISSILERTISTNRLIDMDWSFGVTSASDDMDQVGKTYLQLKMTVESSECVRTDIFMELSLEQFYNFLAQMEKCKSYLELTRV